MHTSEAESERYFRDLLRDVIDTTAPYGIVHFPPDSESLAERSLDVRLVARLRERARLLEVDPASVLHVAWALVVSRTSGRDDVVFGTAIRGESLPLRIRLASATVRDAVVQVDRALAELSTLESASLGLAERCSAVPAGVPLFTASLEYVRADASASPGVTEPIVLSLRDHGKDLVMTVRVRGAIELEDVCEMTSIAIEQLVTALERDPATIAGALDILPPADRQRIVVDWNATARSYPRRCIHELFEERVLVAGDAPAVIFNETTRSYAQLNADANRLARHLVQLGVSVGDHVALVLPRSIELVVAQLAILKCGAAYVPLDERAPGERNAFMIKDCGARIVLTSRALDELDLEAYSIDNLNISIDSGAAAYVMYTSGSTGEPKGCEVAHRSVGRLVFDNGYTPFTPDDRVAFVSNPAFDASLIELWAPLYTGGAIVVIDRETLLEPTRFAAALEAGGVTILSLTVALFNRYAGMIAESFTRLRCLIVGGDVVDATIIADVVKTTPPGRFVHAYGPTETTLFATTYEVVHVPDGASSIPIGRPISNTRIYILDHRGRPTPIGVAGELCIAGEGVARGYLNRPELTAERFVPDPFHDGERMYKTGDLARYRRDGNIEFLGRTDTQVKIRGFRVELGEIETRIMAFGGIDEVIVIAIDQGGGSKRLVAYCTGHLDVPALKQHLRKSLPEYMVPSAYMRLDAFPLTANLKIDRRALPAPVADDTGTAPSTPNEELVAAMWREVLGVEHVGVGDDFFELGGHSLLAMQVVARIRDTAGVQLSVRAFFDRPTIRDLARAIADGSLAPAEIIPRVSRTEPTRLSSVQEQLWFVHALDPASAAYNIPFALRLRGALDVEVLAQSVDEIVGRHDILRVTIAGAVPYQRASSPAPCRLRAEPVASASEAEALAAAEARRGFDLEHGPLIRTRLLRLDATEHVLLVTMHHIVSDAWSCGVFQRELLETYASLASPTSGEPRRPELAIQYADYASWERTRGEQGALASALEYWRAHVAGAPLVLDLPTDRTRPPMQTFAGARHRFALAAGSLEAIAKLCRAEGVTPFMTLFAVFGVLLHRYTAQDKILVGVPVANRNRTDTENLIGMFVNTLAFAADLSGDPTFQELLQRVRGATLGGFAHQELPFTKLVEELQPARDLSRSPIVQVMFAYQSAAVQPPSRAAGLTATRQQLETGTSKFELMLELEPRGAELAGWIEYNTDLFDGATIARFVQHFEVLLEALVTNPATRVSEASLLTPAERHQLLVEWNDTAREVPNQRLEELFEAQVERTPDAAAVRFEGAQLTYRELDARANQLANRLRELGVAADVLVPICVERSLEMLVGILGILKAGGAYVPLEPGYPPDRLAFMVSDTAPRLPGRVIVAQSSVVDRLPSGTQILCLDRPQDFAPHEKPPRAGTATDLAYGIYTSGSTGKPKCALVAHRAVVNLLTHETYQLDSTDRVLQKTPLTFDASVPELFGPLLVGACVVVARPDGHKDVGYLLDMIRAEQITTITFVPSLLELFVAERSLADCGSLRRVLVGGEALSSDVQARFFARLSVELHNTYGPTETTVTSSFWVCQRDTADRTVPIGRPVTNTKLYVLDARQEPVPIGVPGELYIGGLGLARGYLNRPELTAERFVRDPFAHGSRLYRTGDVVRYRADGALEFLGRTDHQVKLRGFRIELGEIETALREHPEIREAVVMAREDVPGHKHLVAYLVATSRAPRPEELQRLLRGKLPEYMIPSSFVVLDAFPLMVNGKVDRKALPAPVWSTRAERIAPSNPTEELIAGMWREILGVEQLGVDDDFFELGGHSLLAMQVISRIRDATGVALSVRAFFDAPTIRALARASAGGSHTPIEPIPRVSRTEPVPLSSTQEQLWFVHALDPSSVAYNIPLVFRLRGPLDVDVLAHSLDEVVRRHDVLRATIAGAIPHQRVSPPAPIALRVEPVGSAHEAELLAAAEVRRGFDLEQGPLFRARLLRLDASEHLLVVTMHHIISDGWSCSVFQHELFEAYESLGSGESRPRRELAFQYADYASWARGRRERGALTSSLEYWRAQVADAPHVLELPTDRTRPPVQTYAGARQRFVLSATTLESVAKLCRAEGVTPFMTLFAVFGVLLHRYTGQDKILAGVPVSNRNRTDTERMIGLFINTLAFTADLSGDPTFREVLQRVRSATLGGFAHQDLPFHELVEAVKPARDFSRSPIVQVMFAYQSVVQEPRTETAGLTVTRMPIETGTSKFELTLDLEPHGPELVGSVEYNTDLFDSSTIARFIQHFELLVETLVADPAARVSEVSMVTPTERHQLLVEWNDTAREIPDQRLDELFEAQVERTPDAVAVSFEGAHLTYRELNARANQLAHRLRTQGVGPDVLVPLYVERSLEVLAGILGILKAGGAYVPLDPEYPADRVAFMLKDSAPPVILTQTRFRDRLPRGPWHVLCLDTPADGSRDNPTRVGTPTDLAYGIYTSGSTGTPKCALVMHRGVVNLLAWMQDTYKLDPSDRVLQKTPLIFDASVRELFWPLLVGARVVVARPEGHKDVSYLLDVIRAEQITTINFVPSLLDLFVDEPAVADCVSLRRVLSGGEALSEDVRARFYARSKAALYNHYGPTETTVTSAFWPCPRETTDRTVPIGRPVANTQLYVLDGRQQPVPIGVPGELYIGGAGLARGYLNRPELTAERFVPDPFTRGSRLYRTGDVVRYRGDGALEYLGRTDYQIKIRGFRVELGEIEASLREHPAIREAVVVVREDLPGHKHLVAYVATPSALQPDELRGMLRARLPEYMIPSAFVVLDAFPLMVNGKVDRKALPAPTWSAGTRSLVAPRNPMEELIAGIWREVLGIEQVGVTDDFFELGGHSLLAMQVVARIRRSLEVDIQPRLLLQAKTIEHQARQVTRRDAEEPVLQITRTDVPIARATIAQEQFWYLSQEDPDPTAYFISNVFVLEGPLDRTLLERSYCELVAYHSIFRTKFREIEGVLHQIVLPEPAVPPNLEFERRHDVPEDRYDDEIKRCVAELMALPCDLAAGFGVIRARLIELAPERHLLIFLIHHIASDGAAFPKQLFGGYAQLRDGHPSALPDERPLQYIDFAHARARWRETPQWQSQRAYWMEQVREVRPLELPFDFPRAPLDARRDALPLGIVPALNYPPEYLKLPDAARAAVIKAARTEKTTPYMIYLGALAWLFHQMSGQDEISIQTTYSNRPEYPVLEQVQGPLAWWTHIRIDSSGKPTFRELVRRTSLVVEGARQNTMVEEYFSLVPHYARRSAFNYLPLGAMPTEERVSDLTVVRKRQPFPRWKRHWDMHLTLMDFATETVLVWTGCMELYRQETVLALLQRYVDVLAHAAD